MRGIFLFIGTLTMVLQACQNVQDSGAFYPDTNQTIDGYVTGAEYRAALRRVKGLLLNNGFLTAEENSFVEPADINSEEEKQKATDINKPKYIGFVQKFLEDPAAVVAIQKYYFKLFDTQLNRDIYNYNEPANLAAYLFKNRKDFRDIAMADYCISDIDATDPSRGLEVTRCLSKTGTDGNGTIVDVPMELRAGILSTQAFLDRYKGAKNFRRPKMAFKYMLCSKGPDYGETAGWEEVEGSNPIAYSGTPPQYVGPIKMHPFYWSSINKNPTMDCTACHGKGGLNQLRQAFVAFNNDNGSVEAGQQVLRRQDSATVNAPSKTINTDEASVLSLGAGYTGAYSKYGYTLTTPFEPNTGITFLGEPIGLYDALPANATNTVYAKLSDVGRAFARHEKFPGCMVTWLWQFASAGRPFDIEYRAPSFLEKAVAQDFMDSGYDLKSALESIFTNAGFLNRDEK